MFWKKLSIHRAILYRIILSRILKKLYTVIMSLNCNEINLILEELNLTNSWIQDIIQPGYDTLAFYTYREGTAKTVLICTAQNSVRINETRKKITKNPKPLRFMEFLKSRIKGAKIISCSQIGLERVIKIVLSHQSSENPEEFDVFNLYIKLWNNAANVILCDKNDLILETMFRRPEQYEVKDEVYIPPAPDPSKFEDSERFPVRDYKNAQEGQPEFASFNEFIDYWYSENARNLSRTSLLEKAVKWYNTNLSKLESALNNLTSKQESFKNAGQF